MSLINWLQFLLISIGVYVFSIFTQIIYFSDSLCSSLEDNSKYDYVIVGAGTAGSLVAHRLAKETNFSFIVLEAGGNSFPWLEIPVLGPLLHGSVYDWNYETIPQEHSCLARKQQKCKVPQGKIVGGSAKLNNMVHVQGNLSHYVNWFHGKFNENYIKSQFEYIETNILQLENIWYSSKLGDAILDAAKELKKVTSEIKNFSKTIVTQKHGKRWTISDYLDLNNVRSNVLVEQIIYTENTAIGVSVIHSNQRKRIFAKKAVILSAGTFNTPKILQLSGIGPKEVLNPLNVTVRKVLPVGKNLQDHVTTGLDLVMLNTSLSVNAMSLLNPVQIFKYFFQGEGALTSPGCEAIGFLSTNNSTEPDLQFMVLPVGIASDRGAYLKDGLGINNYVWTQYFAKSCDKHTATILPILLHPKSIGEVYINSVDARKPISIDPRYLTHQNDIDKLVKGLKLVEKFLNTEAMKSIGAYLNPERFPGCEHMKQFSDQYWECYIRQLTLTSYHPVGTCSMGLPSSKNTVVDTSFKVLGFNRLYVVDGSILPSLPSGNINAAIAMMANIFYDTVIGKHIHSPKNSDKFCDQMMHWNEYVFQHCFITSERNS